MDGEWTANGSHQTDTWYNIRIVTNVATKTYSVYVNDEAVGALDFGTLKEISGTLEGARVNYSGQGDFYIVMPENIPEGVKLPVVIAVHGSGRGAYDYRDTDFYAQQKNIAVANGYIFAAISNGRDTWGLDDGLYNLNLFYDYLIANYPIQEKAALWATSAGGTLANRMVKDYPEKVRFVMGTFPVYDLVSGFNVNSCKTAWGTSDLEAFKALIAGKNPAEFPDALKNHDYYIAHGSVDSAVPIAENSQKMLADVGGNVHLQVIEGGVHGTKDFSFYSDIIEQAFADYPVVFTYTLTDLVPGINYQVHVEATDENGYSSVSNTVFFRLSENDGATGEPQTPQDPQDPLDPQEPQEPQEPGGSVTPGENENKLKPAVVIGIASACVAVCGVGVFAVWSFIKKKKK